MLNVQVGKRGVSGEGMGVGVHERTGGKKAGRQEGKKEGEEGGGEREGESI